MVGSEVSVSVACGVGVAVPICAGIATGPQDAKMIARSVGMERVFMFSKQPPNGSELSRSAG